MSTTTLPQPAYGPQGQPYALQFRNTDGPLAVRWFWTEAAAWAAWDYALDLGFVMVRVVGAPCRGYAVMPTRPLLQIEE